MAFGLSGKKRNQAQGFAKPGKKERWPRATFRLEGIKTPSVVGLFADRDAHQLHEFLQSLLSLLQSDLHLSHISEAIQGIVAGFCPTTPTPVTPPTPFDGTFHPPEIGYGGGVNLPPAPEINVGGAVATLTPPVLLPIDPVTGLPKAGVNNSEAIAIAQIPPVTLTLVAPTRTIDLTQIFTSKLGGQLYYEITGRNSDSLEVKIAGNQLQLTALGKAGVNTVAIRVMDSYGNFSTANLSVTTESLNPEIAVKPRPNIKESLDHLTAALEQNPEDLLAGFETPEGEQALEDLTGL